MTNKRFRSYCWTLNNYTQEELHELENIKCKYIIYGYETAPTTGTQHLQGFIIFTDAKTLNATIKKLPKRVSKIQPTNGTNYENFTYCSKCQNFTERGERPKQGQRNDLIKIKQKIQEGTKIKPLLDSNAIVNYQQLKFAEGLQKYYENTRNWDTYVEWYHGATGTGKTKTAYEKFLGMTTVDNIYTTMDCGKWWEGYDGQEYVVIDDMRGDFMKYHQLLKLLDRYPYRVECKGSSRQFIAKHIIITSPYPPQEIFSTKEDIKQLTRRINEIILFK